MKQILMNHLHIVVPITYRSSLFLFYTRDENDYFSHISETNLVTINRHFDNVQPVNQIATRIIRRASWNQEMIDGFYVLKKK